MSAIAPDHRPRVSTMSRGLTVSRPSRSNRNRSRQYLWVAVAALIAVMTTGCFRQSSHTRALRDSVLEAAGKGWDAEIELGVGALTFGLVRSGSVFLDLPPEAKTVIRSMRGADVGVYKYFGVERPKGGVRFLQVADEALSERGWERMVGVIDGDETVGVFVPTEIKSTDHLEICVLVVSDYEMVIVSARGNPEPLIAMALEQARLEMDLASVD